MCTAGTLNSQNNFGKEKFVGIPLPGFKSYSKATITANIDYNGMKLTVQRYTYCQYF